MFSPDNPRILPKSVVWPRITRGEVMRLTIDLEGSGFVREQVPYATPAYPFITEYGDCLTDLHGNYLNSGQIFPRRPEWLVAQPSALILQRLKNGPQDLDSPERPDYWSAMASMAWRIENAAYAYPEIASHLGLEREFISYENVNAQFSGGKKEGSDVVIPIRMLDDNGLIVTHARYHPDRRMVSYLLDHKAEDNRYYIDKSDGRAWKWVKAGLAVDFFNGRYDIPLICSNLYRAGFDPSDTTFLYARGSPTSRQNDRNHVTDVRDLAYLTHLFGPQGENGLQMGELVDPATGEVRRSEALGRYLDANSRMSSHLRFVSGGAFMPHDGSMHDDQLDHGAMYDTLTTVALRNLCEDLSPWIAQQVDLQADEKARTAYLTSSDTDTVSLPLFSLPVRLGGKEHTERPYWYLGNDDQVGRFKKQMFLLADGSLHNAEFRGKRLNKLSVEEWADFLSGGDKSAGKVLRSESLRYMPTAIKLEDVFKHTSQATAYRDKMPAIKQDCRFIADNPEMMERILAAQAIINHRRRFNSHFPQVPLMEDELPGQYAGEVHYMDDEFALEKAGKGPFKLPGIVETLRNGANNVYGNYMRAIDRAGREMCLKAHQIDTYYGADPDTIDSGAAEEVLHNFSELCNRSYAVFKAKDCPYAPDILDGMKRSNGKPYFRKGKAKFTSIQDALNFRTDIGLRAMEDFERLLKISDGRLGLETTDKYFCYQKSGKRRLFLFADPDNGEKGAAPAVVDEKGREISLETIKGLNKSDVNELLINRENRLTNAIEDIRKGRGLSALPEEYQSQGSYVASGIARGADTYKIIKDMGVKHWNYRFYRLRSEPTVLRIAHRFVSLGMQERIPPKVRTLYEADLQRRMRGMPSESRDTSRINTIDTCLHEVKRLEMAAGSKTPGLLERARNPQVSETARALNFDESARILKSCRQYYSALKRQHARPSAIHAKIGGHMPESGLSYDFIPYQINRDPARNFMRDPNFRVVDVPIWHVIQRINNQDIRRLPPRGLIVPNLAFSQTVLNKNHKPLLIRVIETGQIYACGPVSGDCVNQNDPVMASLVEAAYTHYEQAGRPLSKDDKLTYIGIEDLYPLGNTRLVDHGHQSFKLPHPQFYGLVSPRFAAISDKPLTSVIVPVDYSPQALAPGKPVSFREAAAPAFANFQGDAGQETGHIYESTLRDVIGFDKASGQVEGIKLGDFEKAVRAGTIPERVLERAGVMGLDHFRTLKNAWVTSKWRDDPDNQRVLVAIFDRVNETYFKGGRRSESSNSWAFAHPLDAPEAALRIKGKPVPPNIYLEPD